MEANAYTQNQIFEAAIQFAKTQGIVPAPESAPRDQGRDRRGDRGAGGRRGARDPVQPLRPRRLRHAGVRRLPQRPPARGRVRPADEDAALADLPDVRRSGERSAIEVRSARAGRPRCVPGGDAGVERRRVRGAPGVQDRGLAVQVVAWEGEIGGRRGDGRVPGPREWSVSALREGCAELRDVGVAEDRQRRGIGRRLIAASEEAARAARVRSHRARRSGSTTRTRRRAGLYELGIHVRARAVRAGRALADDDGARIPVAGVCVYLVKTL